MEQEIKMLKSSDISKILGINRNKACELFRRKDFPAIMNCGEFKVEYNAFYNWLQQRHDETEDIEEQK